MFFFNGEFSFLGSVQRESDFKRSGGGGRGKGQEERGKAIVQL